MNEKLCACYERYKAVVHKAYGHTSSFVIVIIIFVYYLELDVTAER